MRKQSAEHDFILVWSAVIVAIVLADLFVSHLNL
jgi:hypothetical protein